jgi:hypothetical protein
MSRDENPAAHGQNTTDLEPREWASDLGLDWNYPNTPYPRVTGYMLLFCNL